MSQSRRGRVLALDEALEPDDPAGEYEGTTSHVTRPSLKPPIRELAAFLSEEACLELAGLDPSRTRFRVWVEADGAEPEVDTDENSELFGFKLALPAKPLASVGADLVAYLRAMNFTGTIALEWLVPKGRVLHFLNLPEESKPATFAPAPAANPLRAMLTRQVAAGGDQGTMMLAMVDMMREMQRESAERVDRMMAEQRQQTADLIRALKDNDPVRELGAEMLRAGNEAVVGAVRDTISKVTNQPRKGLSDFVEEMRAMKDAQAELSGLLGGGAPQDDEIDRLIDKVPKLAMGLRMLKGGDDSVARELVNNLSGKGNSLMDTA